LLWIAKCPGLSVTSKASQSRHRAFEDIRVRLVQYLQNEGRSYISLCKGTSEIINCPEGYIELPVDVWRCKLSKKVCSIQAQVLTTNKQEFMSGCHAPKQRKEAILKAVKDGKYDGFHHIPGRYLCPSCKGKIYRRYYYPWELTLVSKFLGVSGAEQWLLLEKNLIEKNMDPEVGYLALCPKCFKKVVSKVDPKFDNELEILEVDFFP